jgi:vitamin B12 transporter
MTFLASPFRAPAWKPLALASAISAIFVSPVHAQTDDVKSLPPVVVTASRIEQSQAEAIPHTTVITAEDIRNSQATDVPSLLKTQAGAEISQNGGAGSVTSLFMRGANSNQSLILIDGVPIRDATELGTVVALQNIHPDQIERIEIVRGNVSAIYGSGAVGGVIQIFTKQGTGEPKANLSGEVGSRGTTKVSGGFSGKSGDTRYMISATRFRTDGFSSMNTKQYPKENPDKDGDRNISAAGALSHEWSKGNEFGIRFYANDSKYNYDGGGFSMSPTSIYSGNSKQQTTSAFSKNRFSSHWLSTLTVSHTETEREAFSLNGSINEYGFKSNSNLMQWNNEVMISPNWIMTAGLDAAREYGRGWDTYSSPTFSESRLTSSMYAGMNGKFDAHSVQVNLRRDHVGGVDNDTTGYLGYGYALAPAWKLIASTSTAFLAPNLYQLYDPYSGNADLKAERARSSEAGVQYAEGGLLTRATMFQSHTRDQIDYDFGTNKYRNIDRSSNHGMELSASGRLGTIDMRSSLTLQSPKDETTGEALSKRAKTLASVAASKPFGAWRIGGDVQYVGYRPEGTHELPSYVLANLNTRYKVNKEVSVYGRIENLFDREYQTAYGYNQAGRGFFTGIEWRQ